ncbi:hypothetical protein [Parasphingorhabdus sp.]|uniref:hypothetical protein n=1 Tax=Parasphingorhabdus sp. TaxID=2709688 RepID=UPI003A8D4F26
MANKVVAGGKINNAVLMSCSNGMRENWTTYHAPRDHSFFSQELVLGEGDYTLSLIPAGNFRFNAFVYEGDARQYVGGRQNISSYSHRFNIRDWSGQKYHIQMKKIGQACRGCAVTMVLTARNCASKPSRPNNSPTAPLCQPDQCADPNAGLFGLPSCRYKKGARGGYCGTPGN